MTTFYRRKPEVVRAAQFDGTAWSLAALGLRVELDNGVATVHDNGDDVWSEVIARGEWVVVRPDGGWLVCTRAEFAAAYEPTDTPI